MGKTTFTDRPLMGAPAWKGLLSYLYPVHIESVSTPYHPQLSVYLARGRYRLSTADAIYSFGDLYTTYARAFARFRWERLPPGETNNVLVLGLGLGSIPQMLENKFNQTFQYTAVEIDEAVIRLAHNYTLRHLRSPVEVHTADAVQFIEQTIRKWSIICCDVFIGDVIPEGLRTPGTLYFLRDALEDGGVLLYNMLSRTKKDVAEAREFLGVFLKIFPEGGYLDVHGNWMLVSEKGYFK